jgi:protein gp37
MASAQTRIEWTNATWNPMTGCTRISAGCDHCYAFTVAHARTRHYYLRQLPVKNTPPNRADPFAPRFWEERLEQPLSWREPRRIFVNSMSDVFHAHFSVEQIGRVFDMMALAHWHQFQVLTKRPERALRVADQLPWPTNVWLGTSIESMAVAHRADALRKVPAAVRFISAEPLLSDVSAMDLTSIHWVIGGGESGADFRAPEVAWARSLRERCVEERVAFFWKQWGGRTPKAGGRLLDGREWNEYPVPAPDGLAAKKRDESVLERIPSTSRRPLDVNLPGALQPA